PSPPCTRSPAASTRRPSKPCWRAGSPPVHHGRGAGWRSMARHCGAVMPRGHRPVAGSTWWPHSRMRPAGCWRKRGVSGHKQEAELTVAPQVVQYVARPGVVVTGDALYCQRALCAQIVAAGGDYLFFVKGNQPSLQEAITVLFAAPPPGERFATATQRHQY